MLIPVLLQLSAPIPVTRMIVVLPYYHMFAHTVQLIWPLRAGIQVFVLPRFEPTAYLASIQRYKIELSHVVPPILLFLSKDPGTPTDFLSVWNPNGAHCRFRCRKV